MNRITNYDERGRYDDAIKLAQEWMRGHPDDFLYDQIAIAHLMKASKDAARKDKTAILLQPRESTDGKLKFDPHLLKLPPGDYRVEAVLRGWLDNDFTQADHNSLTTLDAPLLRGESPASTRIMLTP